jgi:KDO2-lipid IV(A) lauroyltransferase
LTRATTPLAEEAIHPAEVPAGWWRAVRRASAAFWLEFMFWWAEHFPPMVLWTRPFFLWFAWRYSRVIQRGTRLNAKRLLPPGATEAEIIAFGKRVLTSFYISIYEIGASSRMSVERLRTRIDGVEGESRYFAARAAHKGAILVTAHLGSFELGAVALLDLERHLHVVFRRDEFPRFERIRSRFRKRIGVHEAAIDEGWAIWARLRDALLADEVVLIQGDRVMPGQRGVAVPFLSGHMLMPAGPLKLARATGAPIIPVFSIRTSLHRVRIVIGEPIYIDPNEAPTVRPDGLPEALVRLAGAIEAQVAAHPDQWLMIEPAWCEDAAREA